ALSTAKKKALRSSMNSGAQTRSTAPELQTVGANAAPLAAAVIKSFSASVSLRPGLSVGAAEPESIYTAQVKTKFQASHPNGGGECEVQLPLPPQIISLAGLQVTVNSAPSESVQIRADKLGWLCDVCPRRRHSWRALPPPRPPLRGCTSLSQPGKTAFPTPSPPPPQSSIRFTLMS